MYEHACFTAKQKTCLVYIHMQKYLLLHTAFHILWTKKNKQHNNNYLPTFGFAKAGK